jgi:beta-mannanase
MHRAVAITLRIILSISIVTFCLTVLFLQQKPTVKAVAGAKIAAPKRIASPTITPIPTTLQRNVAIGMWTQGFWDDQAKKLHPELLHDMEVKLGKKMAIAHYFRGWDVLDSEMLLKELGQIAENGWTPMVSANPYFFEKCQSNNVPLYRAIAQGNCDEFLHAVGKNLRRFKKPLFLRFAWEMNVSTMEWGIARTGSTNEDFIAAWRKVYAVVRSEGAGNVRFVFCPNVSQGVLYKAIYPGDAYVDWVGLDGYNWGTTQSWSVWQTFAQVFSASYIELKASAPQKPFMLGEINTTDKGGSKPAWYTDMLSVQIPYNYAVDAVIFYNEDRTQTEQVNWLIDVDLASYNAFKNAINSPIYQSYL